PLFTDGKRCVSLVAVWHWSDWFCRILSATFSRKVLRARTTFQNNRFVNDYLSIFLLLNHVCHKLALRPRHGPVKVLSLVDMSGVAESSRSPKNKILVVEDHSDIRKILVLRLKELGYEVFEAETGLDAFRQARTRPPDLILMDLGMPVVGGD